MNRARVGELLGFASVEKNTFDAVLNHENMFPTLATLATGGTVVVPGKFNPLSFWRVARDYGVTWYSAVPTLHQLLLAKPTS
mgnify:CR=1 FL=1